jgi:hypothetical protein
MYIKVQLILTFFEKTDNTGQKWILTLNLGHIYEKGHFLFLEPLLGHLGSHFTKDCRY